MTFEFQGADLEAPDGITAFKRAYVDLGDSPAGDAFNDMSCEDWVARSPEAADAFLRDLASDESPRVRDLAARLAHREWIRLHSDVAVEVMTTAMMDEDSDVRRNAREIVEESLQGRSFDDWTSVLGLPRMQQMQQAVELSRREHPGDEFTDAHWRNINL